MTTKEDQLPSIIVRTMKQVLQHLSREDPEGVDEPVRLLESSRVVRDKVVTVSSTLLSKDSSGPISTEGDLIKSVDGV